MEDHRLEDHQMEMVDLVVETVTVTIMMDKIL